MFTIILRMNYYYTEPTVMSFDSCCTSKHVCCFKNEEQAKVHLPSTVQ